MYIGVPKETKEGERRVALTPAGVHLLTGQGAGHTVLVQAGAGLASGMEDDEYEAAGARIVTADQAWGDAEMVVKVKEPLPGEYQYLRPDMILFTYLHLASSRELATAVRSSGVTAIGYETVETDAGDLPLLAPMSEVAGRLAAQTGAHCLTAHEGGRGILLGGVPGVPPADVVVVGCGIVGMNAAKIAMGMGAQVTILDINHDRLRYLDDVMRGRAITWYSTPYDVARAVRFADLVIGAVLLPGARAPKLLTRQMVQSMRTGAVIVDVAIDQGGCVETIRPTSHSEPTYLQDGVVHYAVPNIPARVPRTSTFALSSVTVPYIRKVADLGLEAAAHEDVAIRRGINTANGRFVHPAVQEVFEGSEGQ